MGATLRRFELATSVHALFIVIFSLITNEAKSVTYEPVHEIPTMWHFVMCRLKRVSAASL